ncbi:hypothetical protein BH09BAC6_BH09BAC6_30880 [soil metagenome]|jgi:hypothetical protein
MKTLTLTAALLVATVLGLSNTASAAVKFDEKQSTVLTEVTRVNQIEVYGNVELYVSDGSADQVKVYNRYYQESALVQDQNGVLRISSYKAEKLIVWVTVSDLRSLSLYDNATVKSFGKLSALALDVKLYNNASAELDLDACQANISLSNQAKANLSGTINEGELKYDRSAFVNITKLVCINLAQIVNFGRTEKNTLSDIAAL